jgi:hypothetical protein
VALNQIAGVITLKLQRRSGWFDAEIQNITYSGAFDVVREDIYQLMQESKKSPEKLENLSTENLQVLMKREFDKKISPFKAFRDFFFSQLSKTRAC